MTACSQWAKKLMAAGLAAGVLPGPGCRLLFFGAVADGANGAVAYVDGKFVDTLGNPYDQVVTATEKVITQLSFAQPEERKDERPWRFWIKSNQICEHGANKRGSPSFNLKAYE